MRETRAELRRLQRSEETYWAQRARILWLREGDKNTRFFHVRTSHRHKKNKIDKLKDARGAWVLDSNGIGEIIEDILDNGNNQFDDILDKISRCVTSEMGNDIDRLVTDREILDAFNQMDPRKALGIDGLSGTIFKEN